MVVPSGAVTLKSKSFTNTGVALFKIPDWLGPAGSVQQIVALNVFVLDTVKDFE